MRYSIALCALCAFAQPDVILKERTVAANRAPRFPRRSQKLFLQRVDTQITFTADGLVLHQNRADMSAKRIKA